MLSVVAELVDEFEAEEVLHQIILSIGMGQRDGKFVSGGNEVEFSIIDVAPGEAACDEETQE